MSDQSAGMMAVHEEPYIITCCLRGRDEDEARVGLPMRCAAAGGGVENRKLRRRFQKEKDGYG